METTTLHAQFEGIITVLLRKSCGSAKPSADIRRARALEKGVRSVPPSLVQCFCLMLIRYWSVDLFDITGTFKFNLNSGDTYILDRIHRQQHYMIIGYSYAQQSEQQPTPESHQHSEQSGHPDPAPPHVRDCKECKQNGDADETQQ